MVAVHTIQPFTDLDGLHRGLADVAQIGASLPSPAVLAGDFNATSQHAGLRAVLERTGFRDAHQASGRGLARSWPAGRGVAFALLDRILVHPDIAVIATSEAGVPGSDHRAVVAHLRLP